MKPVGMCIAMSSGFALGLAGFSVAAAAFLIYAYLFCCSCVNALTCFSRLELDVAIKTLGAEIATLFLRDSHE